MINKIEYNEKEYGGILGEIQKNCQLDGCTLALFQQCVSFAYNLGK